MLPSVYAKLLVSTDIVIFKFHRDEVIVMRIRQFSVSILKFIWLLYFLCIGHLLNILTLIYISLSHISLISQFMVSFCFLQQILNYCKPLWNTSNCCTDEQWKVWAPNMPQFHNNTTYIVALTPSMEFSRQ